MTGRVEDGGPAFPAPEVGRAHFSDAAAYPGMSLRDYFAAKALAGMLANSGCDYSPMTAGAQLQVVADAYGLADAMLRARSGVAE